MISQQNGLSPLNSKDNQKKAPNPETRAPAANNARDEIQLSQNTCSGHQQMKSTHLSSSLPL